MQGRKGKPDKEKQKENNKVGVMAGEKRRKRWRERKNGERKKLCLGQESVVLADIS